MVIPYGVDLRKYQLGNGVKKRESIGLSADDKIVGMVGRLVPQKGHVYLIDAAELVIKKFPDVKFVIVGDGELKDQLLEKVRARNLEKNFRFLGFRSDVNELLWTFDIFTLPSLYEGLPNVVLEALASSLPVVATPVDGTKEAVVDNETGFLVPVKDVEGLANALIKLLSDPALARRIGKNGRKRVEDVFSLEKQVKSFEKLYESYI